jgi:hypothetical protein
LMIGYRYLAVVASAAFTASPAFALENTYVPDKANPYALEAPDQPQQLGSLWGGGRQARQARC